jgi:Tfp pilus assembly protein PilF
MSWSRRKRSARVFATLVCVSWALSGCATTYEQAEAALAAGELERAESIAKGELRKNPDDARANLLYAQALTKADPPNWRQAKDYAKAAYDSGEIDAQSGRLLGKIYWELGQPIDTVGAWRRARAADPAAVRDSDYLYALRTALTTATTFKSFEEALKLREELKQFAADYPEAVAASPNPDVVAEEIKPEQFTAAREDYAHAMANEGRHEEAAALYAELTRENPADTARYSRARGELMLKLGRTDEAVAALTTYAQAGVGPEREQRMRKSALRAQSEGARGVAITFYEMLLDESSGTVSSQRTQDILELMKLHLALDELDDARRYIDLYLAEFAQLGGSKARMANAFGNVEKEARRQGKIDLAVSLLERAIVEAEPNFGITQSLANHYARSALSGEVERVLKTYVDRQGSTREALEQASQWANNRRDFELAQFFMNTIVNMPNASAQDWIKLARVHAQLARTDDLRDAIKQYLKLRDRSRSALKESAGVFISMRLYEDAEKLLKEAFKEAPDDRSLVSDFENLYFGWGKPDAIHPIYERWIKANGSDPDVYAEVGRFLFSRGRAQEALPYYRKAAEGGENNAYRQIAEIHLRQRRDLDMKKALDAYIAGSKDNRMRALNDALGIYQRSQLVEERVRILEELVSLQPRNRSYNDQLGQQYIEQGRTSDAFELWRNYLAKSSNPQAELQRLARNFSNQGRQRWILMFYEDLISEEGHDKKIYRLIGDTLTDMSQRRRHMFGIAPQGAEPMLDPAELQERATYFYGRYLDEVSLTPRELSDFASSLKQKLQWELAARAYAMIIERSGRPERHILLNYGTTLLKIGDMERAEEYLERYFRQSQSQPHHAAQIADELMAHGRYVAAEPYLRTMLESSQRNHIQLAFQRLAEIYQRMDRQSEFNALIEDYLSKASNPASAREDIILQARSAGLWSLEAQQLEIVNASSGAGQRHMELALALLKAGQTDRARESLRAYATADKGSEGAAWIDVALTYQNRAMSDDALTAIEASIGADPDAYRPYVVRASLLLGKGEHERAEKDFEAAIVKAQDDPARAAIYMEMINGYRSAGLHDLAASAIRDALKLTRVDRATLLTMQANQELGDGDHVKARRLLKTLRRDGVPFENVIALARQHGYLEEAAEMLSEELVAGDYVTASALAINHMDLFTTLGGFDRLELALQPIFDRPRSDRTIERVLGVHLLNAGHTERGALYLRAAWDSGDTVAGAYLASAYVKLGAFSEASELYMSTLESKPASERAITLARVATDYLLANRPAELERLLEHLARDPRYASAAIPLLAGKMARDGAVLGAMTLLRDVVDTRRRERAAASLLFSRDIGEKDAEDAFLAGVVELARAGYPKEARALVVEVDPKIQTTARARRLLARLDHICGELDATGSVAALLNPSATTTREVLEKLDHAQMLLAVDQHAAAREAALEYLDSPDNARSYAALSVLARSARITNELDLIDGWIARFIGASGDRQAARGAAASLLHTLALDDRALALSLESLRLTPTDTTTYNTLRYAQAAGDADALREVADVMWRVNNNPDSVSGQLLKQWNGHQPVALTTPLLDRYSMSRAGNAQNVYQRARVLFISGEVQQARDLLLAYLDRVAWDPIAVEEAVQSLSMMGLHVELAKTLAPRVDPKTARAATAFYLGLAHAHIGARDGARAWLDRYLTLRPDASEAASQITRSLVAAKHTDLAAVYGDIAVDRAPARPSAYFYRGLARAANRDADGARADFERSLPTGVDIRVTDLAYAYLVAGSTAAEFGLDELALDLLAVPAAQPRALGAITTPLSNVGGALTNIGRGDLGLRLLEAHPAALTQSTPHAPGLAPMLSNLYESAGKNAQAFRVYRDALSWELLNDADSPSFTSFPTLNNNLSYTFSTTNENVDEGERLVLKAIALANTRETSYIDTLGWIYFRQGKLDAAEAEISRALRTTEGSDSSRRELYAHLAEIKQAQGDSEAAAWLHAYLSTLQ